MRQYALRVVCTQRKTKNSFNKWIPVQVQIHFKLLLSMFKLTSKEIFAIFKNNHLLSKNILLCVSTWSSVKTHLNIGCINILNLYDLNHGPFQFPPDPFSTTHSKMATIFSAMYHSVHSNSSEWKTISLWEQSLALSNTPTIQIVPYSFQFTFDPFQPHYFLPQGLSVWHCELAMLGATWGLCLSGVTRYRASS